MLRVSHSSFDCRITLLGEPWSNPGISWSGWIPSTCQVWWSSWVWNKIRSDLKALLLDNAQDATTSKWKEQEWRWLLRLEASQREKKPSSFQTITIMLCQRLPFSEQAQFPTNPEVKWRAHHSPSPVWITASHHSNTPVQENTPRKDAAFPRNNNDPLTFLYGMWGCLSLSSRRRQSWPWTVFTAC